MYAVERSYIIENVIAYDASNHFCPNLNLIPVPQCSVVRVIGL